MATQTTEEILELLKAAVKQDIKNNVQMSSHPLADEIKLIEHHLSAIETTLQKLKK